MADDLQLLTPPEVAKILRVADQTLSHWRMTGHGPLHVRLAGNRIAYRRGDVDAWISGRVVATTEQRLP